jgi:hypothetical protein
VLGAAVLALAVLDGVSSAAAINFNISGAWQTVYHCQVGCAGTDYPDTLTLKQAPGSATVTGTDETGGPLNGTLSFNPDNSIKLTLTETDGSYTANFVVTISINGKSASWSGTLSDSNGTSGTDTGTLSAVTLGQTGEAKAVSGTVTVETPGETTFAPLSSTTVIPMGSTINATSGTVALTVAKPGGGTQTAQFYDGEFTLTQSHSGLTTETLAGGSFTTCPQAGRRELARIASAKGAPVRELWGHDSHGKFATSGRGGAATVLGTTWLTVDYCNGTLFKAVKDSISVVAFAHPSVKHRVAQGHSFFVPVSGS